MVAVPLGREICDWQREVLVHPALGCGSRPKPPRASSRLWTCLQGQDILQRQAAVALPLGVGLPLEEQLSCSREASDINMSGFKRVPGG